MIRSMLLSKTGPMTDSEFKTVMEMTTRHIIHNAIADNTRTDREMMLNEAAKVYRALKYEPGARTVEEVKS